MTAQIALLRGINVGAHKRIPMAGLRELLERLGYGDARTLLQSGNVVLSSGVSAKQLAGELEAAIEDEFGVQTPVVVRTREELAAVVARDPLGEYADQSKLYQVSFLSAEPDPERIAKIAAVDIEPERFEHHGLEIYAWHPKGVHGSRLAPLLSDKRLGVIATARNWNTVTKLLQIADEFD
jgi:uncharacterized protein (DUF1697 family)